MLNSGRSILQTRSNAHEACEEFEDGDGQAVVVRREVRLRKGTLRILALHAVYATWLTGVSGGPSTSPSAPTSARIFFIAFSKLIYVQACSRQLAALESLNKGLFFNHFSACGVHQPCASLHRLERSTIHEVLSVLI